MTSDLASPFQEGWDNLLRFIESLVAKIAAKPEFRWATVTGVKPLRIRLDGDEEPLEGKPSTVVRGLAVGERILVAIQSRRVTVISRTAPPRNRVLWEGAWYMHSSQSAVLSELVTDQEHGIVLVWQGYKDGVAQQYDIIYVHVPKWHAEQHAGKGMQSIIWPGTSGTAPFMKYLYVHNNRIDGNTINNQAPRTGHVLTAVLGY